MFAGRLIEILDVVGHHGCGDSFPCLFYDQAFSAFLDSHFLSEDIHNNENDKRKKDRIILHFVYLKDDEFLVKQGCIQVIVKDVFLLTTAIERLQNGRKVMDCKLNVLLDNQLRDSFKGKLIIGIERKFLNFEILSLSLHLVNLTLNAKEIIFLYHLWSKALKLMKSSFLLSLSGSSIIQNSLELINESCISGRLLFLHDTFIAFLQFQLILVILSILLILKKQHLL